MHAEKRAECVKGRGTAGKTPVVGVKDRASGRVAAKLVADTDTATLVGIIEETTQPGAGVFTDGHSGYGKLNSMGFTHDKVKHTDGEYVRDDVSINGIENYWSLLKRCIVGTWHYLSTEHLHRYVHEQLFR